MPKATQWVVSGTPASLSSSNSLCPSQQAFRVRSISHLLCFANLRRTLRSLRCLKIPHSKMSATAAERNRVKQRQHGSLGSCLEKSFSPERHLGARRVWLGQQFPLCSRRQSIHRKEKEKALRKRQAPQSGQIGLAGHFLPEKQEAWCPSSARLSLFSVPWRTVTLVERLWSKP